MKNSACSQGDTAFCSSWCVILVGQYDGNGWRDRTVSIDPETKMITAALLSPVSQLAVAPSWSSTILIIR